MLFSHLLSLVLSFSVLRCASIEGGESKVDDTEESEIDVGSNSLALEQSLVAPRLFSSQGISFSVNFNEELFLKILEYVAKSPGKMAMTCKRIKELVQRTSRIRFYEGAGWSMPELSNVCNFGILTAGDSEEVVTEMKMITSLAIETDEQAFNQKMDDLLINYTMFQNLAGPVLKYLVRVFLNGHGGNINGTNLKILSRLYVFAAKRGHYDVIFEIKKYIDPVEKCIGQSVIDDGFYFDYFNWVYDNPRALNYVLDRMALVTAGDKSGISLFDINAWTAVCIHRSAPESFYIDYLLRNPTLFITAFQNYFVKFNLITVDVDENQRHHEHVRGLIDRYLRGLKINRARLSFLELLNDVRYGPEDSELYQDRITAIIEKRDVYNMSMLIMTASKANKKELIKQLLNHPQFDFGHLNSITEFKNPHSFKVYFDIIEANLQGNFNERIFENSIAGMISSIINSKLKITSAVSLTNGIKFKIESPKEYVDLGFSKNYEFVLPNEGRLRERFIFDLRQKMIDDAADAGLVEFKDFITKHFGDRTHVDHNPIMGSRFRVSFKVIRLLLENVELITILRNRNIKLLCHDTISDELIAGFRDVINPLT